MGNYYLIGIEFQFYKIKRVMGMAEVTVTGQCECILYHWTVHLNVVKMVNFVLCVFYHNKKRKKISSQS